MEKKNKQTRTSKIVVVKKKTTMYTLNLYTKYYAGHGEWYK